MSHHFVILGHPLGHSMSPRLHSRLFELAGVEADYQILDLDPAVLAHPDSIALLRGLDGFNITIPYKTDIIPLLDELDDSAALYESVNTVARRPDGTLRGYNTDVDGFVCTLDHACIPIGGRVCVVGAGGVGRTFAIESARRGAAVTLAVRLSGISRAQELARFMVSKNLPPPEVCLVDQLAGPFDLLINASPSGMFPHVDAMPVAPAVLDQVAALFDAVYNPTDTLLLRTARERGIRCVGGMEMLVWQAVVAHRIWDGSDYDPAELNKLTNELCGAVDAMNR